MNAPGSPPVREGQRIRLVQMGSDDPDPIPPGATGTVACDAQWIVDRWQIAVNWDVPRSLNLVVPPDRYEVIG